MKKILSILVILTGISTSIAQPNWAVDARNFSFTLTCVCQVNVDGKITKDTGDMLAAFVGSECRGVGKINEEGLCFFTVYSNTAKGERISLKYWSNRQQKVIEMPQTLAFKENASYGEISSPMVFYTDLRSYRLPAFNVFSPNGDGKNDLWVVNDLSIVEDLQMTICDIQGNVVYRHPDKGYDNTWNGTSTNGNQLPTGTYIYLFHNENNKVVFRGSVTIVR